MKSKESFIHKMAAANLKAEKVKTVLAGTVIAAAAFLLTVVMTYGYFIMKGAGHNAAVPSVSADGLLALLAVVLIILLACWMAVYNIFYISVAMRVRFYGRLRALGAVHQQIRQLVVYEGKLLSRRFIPCGILPGYLAGRLMVSSGWDGWTALLLAALAAAFTGLTVRISLRTPASYAAKITPAEGIRHIEASISGGQKRISTRRLSPFRLAWLQLSRSRKKTVFSLLSLAFSGVLFMVFAALLTSADPASRAQAYFPGGGQFSVQLDDALYSPEVGLDDLQSKGELSAGLHDELLSIAGVEAVYVHQYLEAELAGMNNTGEPVVVGIANITEHNRGELDKQLITGTIPEHTSGGAPALVINSASSEYAAYGLELAVGDRVLLRTGSGSRQSEHEAVIAGEIRDTDSGTLFLAASETMPALAGFNPAQSMEISAANHMEKQVGQDIQQLMAQKGMATLKLVSYQEVAESFRDAFRSITLAGYALIGCIAAFSLLNLLNTLIAAIVARTYELGIMQAIGMKRKQLTAMLTYEACMLIAGSAAFAFSLGNLLGYWLTSAVSRVGGLSYISYRFPGAAIILYGAVIALILGGVIRLMGYTISRQNVVERLKQSY
ncbi:ABC transporter permease [Paenibacillus tepidiphilus]|uniref:ABC transporter permease n=1 Tax=Paenibacillus tepidiphilus TaxID=2608683 RepID=UPI00123BEADB|nr:FtsX-like permease family protein [Paenibacillus tepidiphilus]